MARRSKVTRVTSKDERKRGNLFLRLKADEKFVGIALFEPDPGDPKQSEFWKNYSGPLSDKENPGYVEYYDFWDQDARQYVPASEDTAKYFRGTNPSSRALTVWYFPDNDPKEKFKVFTMNWNLIQEAADLLEDEETIAGKAFRVVRLDDRGEYRLRLRKDKPLTKAALKKLMEDDEFPDIVGILDANHDRQLQRLAAMELVEEDEDDEDDDEVEEEEEKPKARRGKKKSEPVDEEDDEDEDDEEDEDDVDDEDDENEDDEEEDEEEEDEEDEEDEEEVEGVELEGVTVAVVEVDENNETFKIEHEGEELDLWLNEDVEIDWSKFSSGDNIVIDAIQDEEGDLVATAVKKKRRTRAKAKK